MGGCTLFWTSIELDDLATAVIRTDSQSPPLATARSASLQRGRHRGHSRNQRTCSRRRHRHRHPPPCHTHGRDPCTERPRRCGTIAPSQLLHRPPLCPLSPRRARRRVGTPAVAPRSALPARPERSSWPRFGRRPPFCCCPPAPRATCRARRCGGSRGGRWHRPAARGRRRSFLAPLCWRGRAHPHCAYQMGFDQRRRFQACDSWISPARLAPLLLTPPLIACSVFGSLPAQRHLHGGFGANGLLGYYLAVLSAFAVLLGLDANRTPVMGARRLSVVLVDEFDVDGAGVLCVDAAAMCSSDAGGNQRGRRRSRGDRRWWSRATQWRCTT